MTERTERTERSGVDAPPPIWRRWSRLYWLVFGLFVGEVLAFWLLTRWAS
ncbi:MAG TPA: hypothetical protein VHN14_16245 [Kofleriaceae bacterium]|jgi:hypothetical protein|nr:hypothetical protein [Kofleriaceae bacterium]